MTSLSTVLSFSLLSPSLFASPSLNYDETFLTTFLLSLSLSLTLSLCLSLPLSLFISHFLYVSLHLSLYKKYDVITEQPQSYSQNLFLIIFSLSISIPPPIFFISTVSVIFSVFFSSPLLHVFLSHSETLEISLTFFLHDTLHNRNIYEALCKKTF